MRIDYIATPELFWRHAEKGAGCWEWQLARSSAGYGVISYFGRQWYAHRLAYLLARGHLSEAALVCHHCDNPRCVRPDHLYEGTYTDNNHDTLRRGRRVKPRDHCRKGHALTPDNTRPAYKAAGVIRGVRCRRCSVEMNRASRERHRRA